MQGVLGEASSLTDYDTVRDRMKSSRYTMDFANGVKFDMAVVMSDRLTAATAGDADEGRGAAAADDRVAAGEVGAVGDDDRLERGDADGGLFVVGQRVFELAELVAVPVGGEVGFR